MSLDLEAAVNNPKMTFWDYDFLTCKKAVVHQVRNDKGLI